MAREARTPSMMSKPNATASATANAIQVANRLAVGAAMLGTASTRTADTAATAANAPAPQARISATARPCARTVTVATRLDIARTLPSDTRPVGRRPDRTDVTNTHRITRGTQHAHT